MANGDGTCVIGQGWGHHHCQETVSGTGGHIIIVTIAVRGWGKAGGGWLAGSGDHDSLPSSLSPVAGVVGILLLLLRVGCWADHCHCY